MNGRLLRNYFTSRHTRESGHMERSGTQVMSSQWSQWNLGEAAKLSWRQYPKHPQDVLGMSSQWTQRNPGEAAKLSWQQYPKHPQDALSLSQERSMSWVISRGGASRQRSDIGTLCAGFKDWGGGILCICWSSDIGTQDVY